MEGVTWKCNDGSVERRVTVCRLGECCRKLDICEVQGYISYPRDGAVTTLLQM